MNVNHESSLYFQIKSILEKNISTEKNYIKASEIAKERNVKLFFKHKAHNRSLFNEKLMFELNTTLPSSNIDGSILQNDFTETQTATLLDICDEILLMDSLKKDKKTLKDFELLLKYPTLPLSIRLIIKEQIIFIRLDELKMEQLIHVL